MGTKDVSAGGNAALYGFIAMLYLDLLQNWPITIRPWVELSKTSMVVLVALAIGLLPFIDNYAHIGGFLGGLFSGMAVMPTISYTNSDRRRKRILRILSIPILIGLMSGGFYMFFSGSNIDCPWCTYLDCVPPGASWCSTNSS
jgi:membrane associated rhomboid family serine protease